MVRWRSYYPHHLGDTITTNSQTPCPPPRSHYSHLPVVTNLTTPQLPFRPPRSHHPHNHATPISQLFIVTAVSVIFVPFIVTLS